MTGAVRRLTKRDVEDLLERYDDDPIGALSTALRRVVGAPGVPDVVTTAGRIEDADWSGLVRAAGFTRDREAALLAGDQAALDALAAELNELRTLAP